MQNGVAADKFFKVYCMLIEEIKEALPNIKIMIMEPFVLQAEATKGNWETFKSETKKRSDMAKKVAEKYNLKFIELQSVFDEAEKKAESSYWLSDGVHPSYAGHELIKREWLKAFKEL